MEYEIIKNPMGLIQFSMNKGDKVTAEAAAMVFMRGDIETVTKMRKGGFITGDDYGREESWHEENVTKAVDDFISLGHVKPIKIKNHEFILQVKKSK